MCVCVRVCVVWGRRKEGNVANINGCLGKEYTDVILLFCNFNEDLEFSKHKIGEKFKLHKI